MCKLLFTILLLSSFNASAGESVCGKVVTITEEVPNIIMSHFFMSVEKISYKKTKPTNMAFRIQSPNSLSFALTAFISGETLCLMKQGLSDQSKYVKSFDIFDVNQYLLIKESKK